MILQAVRILLTLREWNVHASSQCVIRRIKQQKLEYEVVSTVELDCDSGAITVNHTKEVELILRF